MGHGSWFSHFFTGLYAWAQELMQHAGYPANEEGTTWTGLLGQKVEVVHAEGHGAQAFLHVLLVFILLSIIAFLTYSKVKDKNEALIPDDKLTVRTGVELVVMTSFTMMRDVMGDKAARYFLPLIGSCAFFILLSNALGLIPGFLPPTASLNVTLALGVVIFFTTHIYGIKEQGFVNYFKHFLGPIIKWYALPLMLLFLVVETISHIVRPLSLGIRLMANMFADHAVLGVFMGLAAGLFAGFPALIPVPVLLLGSLVVVVQVLVFCLLSTVYIAMAIEHSDDH